MKDITEIFDEMTLFQQRLIAQAGNKRYRETAEVLYIEKLEIMRSYPDQSYFQACKGWFLLYFSRHPLEKIPNSPVEHWEDRP